MHYLFYSQAGGCAYCECREWPCMNKLAVIQTAFITIVRSDSSGMEINMRELERLHDIDKRYRIFGMIFLLSNKLETIGNSFLGELTTKQWFFMLILSTFFENPPTLSQLANQMGTSHQNSKQLAIRLQEKGFLTIEKDELDNRVLRIYSTKKIEEYMKVRQNKDHKFIEEFFSVLKSSEIQELDEVLFRLMDSIQDIEEELS